MTYPHPVTRARDFSAKQVIIATTPALAGRISYTPGVTANRDGMTQRVPMGVTIKCHTVYPTPFWRALGYSGTVQCDNSSGIDVDNCEDNSPQGANPTPGIIVAFLWGDNARKCSDRAIQPNTNPPQLTPGFQNMVLNAFATFFGSSQALSPSFITAADWPTEVFSRGCYAGYFSPGVWTGYPLAISTPVGPIHFAGTETATQWYAYMDGALSAGQRAAAEALQAL